MAFLEKGYLYIYSNSNGTLFECDINTNVEDSGSYNYIYNDIIPYNNQANILNLFISSIKESKNFCLMNCKYNQYINFNINFSNNKLFLINPKKNQFTISYESYKENKKCHLLDSSFIIKCILYYNTYFINIKYDIISDKVGIDKYWVSYNNVNFNEITSSKSDKNNYFILYIWSALYIRKKSVIIMIIAIILATIQNVNYAIKIIIMINAHIFLILTRKIVLVLNHCIFMKQINMF